MLASFDGEDPFWRQWREFERMRQLYEHAAKQSAQERLIEQREAIIRQEAIVRRTASFESQAERLRRDAEQLNQALHPSGLSSLQAAYQEQERARQLIRQAEEFGRRKWASYSDLAFQEAVNAQRQADELKRALHPWQTLVGSSVLEDLASSLFELPPQPVELDISQIVANAVAMALERSHKRLDPRFVWALIIGILTVLIGLPGNQPDPVQEATLSAIQADVAATKRAVEILASRIVLRRTLLRSRPSSQSAVVTALPRGSVVIILERHKKWTKVRLLALGADAERRAEFGWLLNKYVARAP